MHASGGPSRSCRSASASGPSASLALGGRPLEPGTADAIAGIVAIAIERARFLEERHAAELPRQRADLSSALLASLSHDLRTPLTAIQVAVDQRRTSAPLDETLRAQQSALAVAEIDRLARLLQEILDMARIETRGVHAERHVGHRRRRSSRPPSPHCRPTPARRHRLVVDADEITLVQLDPRLTSAALAHVLENAARYSPADRATIDVRAGWTTRACG